MKKTILLVISMMVAAVFSTVAFAQNGNATGAGTMCTVQGTIEVPDFSEDINCKLNLWYGEGSDFDCVRMNEVRVEGLGEGFGMEDVLSNAGEGSGEHITPLERNILQQISSNFDDKLIEFNEACTGDGEDAVLDAEEYIFCKQLLADMKKELGQASQIMWYTPDAFWIVQILDDIQINLDHILAIFDEAARDSFDVVCSDPSVELEQAFNEQSFGVTNGQTFWKVNVGGAANALVSVFSFGENGGEPPAIPGPNCELIADIAEISEGSGDSIVATLSCANGGQFVVGSSDACIRANVVGAPNSDSTNDFDEAEVGEGCGIFGPLSLGSTGSGGITGGVVAGPGGSNVDVRVVMGVGGIALLAVILFVLLRRKN